MSCLCPVSYDDDDSEDVEILEDGRLTESPDALSIQQRALASFGTSDGTGKRALKVTYSVSDEEVRIEETPAKKPKAISQVARDTQYSNVRGGLTHAYEHSWAYSSHGSCVQHMALH